MLHYRAPHLVSLLLTQTDIHVVVCMTHNSAKYVYTHAQCMGTIHTTHTIIILWTFLSLHYVLLHISLSSVSYTDRQIIHVYADTTDCLTSFTYMYSVCVCVCVCVCVFGHGMCTHPFFYTSKLAFAFTNSTTISV